MLLKINPKKLEEFERNLDPENLKNAPFPANVLGFGEISTVLEIDLDEGKNIAFKRMPLFHSNDEVERYVNIYKTYIGQLETLGVSTVPSDIITITPENKNYLAVYILQEKLPVKSIGHKAIQLLPEDEIHRLVRAILRELDKVFQFNQGSTENLSLGIDGQISNWSINKFDDKNHRLEEEIQLVYIDTSTPLMTKDGEEQLDPELFLRSAPSFLVWVLRLFFLEDVLTRYYDFRSVCIDLIANFYKEQHAELVPGLVEVVNDYFSPRIEEGVFDPLTVKEIKAYYREDAMIWRLYLAFRKIDRALHRLLGKEYPYILPGKIVR
jgi:hypothetical protein